MTWPVKKLGEIANILNGYAFKSSDYKTDGVRLLRMSNITRDGTLNFNNKNTKYLDSVFLTKYPKFILNKGDLVVAMTDMSKELGIIGKVTVVTNNGDTLLNQRVGKFEILDKNVGKGFLYFTLLDTNFKKFVENLCAGGLQYNVSANQILKYQISVPPLSNQKKIVERLDAIRKAQELCDQQIQKTEEFFESILEEFEKNHIKLVFKLEDLLVEPLQNGINFSKAQMGRGTLLVNVKDVYTENEIEEDKLERISITEKETRNYSLHEGDILFVRSSVKRDGVGFTAIFKSSFSEPIVYSGFIIRAKADVRKILPQYLLYTTRSKHLRKQIIESSGTSTITNINQGSINRLQISVPDLKTQQKIVEKLEAVQNYKKLLLKQKSLLKGLFDSVLDKSMKGELDN